MPAIARMLMSLGGRFKEHPVVCSNAPCLLARLLGMEIHTSRQGEAGPA